jgi:hypothetical protein
VKHVSTQLQSKHNGHESSELPLKPFLWILAGLIATAVLTHLALICYTTILASAGREFGRLYQIRPSQVPHYPAPALQADPQTDLQAYKFRAEQDLNSYGWIDQARGVVKIPITRAMKLILSRGFPVRPIPQNGPTELDMQTQKAAPVRVNAAK